MELSPYSDIREEFTFDCAALFKLLRFLIRFERRTERLRLTNLHDFNYT